MARFRDRAVQRQAERDLKEFEKTGKASDLAKICLRNDAMDAIWDITDGRGRKKWGQF